MTVVTLVAAGLEVTDCGREQEVYGAPIYGVYDGSVSNNGGANAETGGFLNCLPSLGNCPTGGASATGGSGGIGGKADAATEASCDGRTFNCAASPHTVCVEVQQTPGHCVDWSRVGASSCRTLSDCPSQLPSASFGALQTKPAGPVCVKATVTIPFASDPAPSSSGYCAAAQSASDPTGMATCTPNPCGDSGFCSYVKTASGTTIVECVWPL